MLQQPQDQCTSTEPEGDLRGGVRSASDKTSASLPTFSCPSDGAWCCLEMTLGLIYKGFFVSRCRESRYWPGSQDQCCHQRSLSGPCLRVSPGSWHHRHPYRMSWADLRPLSPARASSLLDFREVSPQGRQWPRQEPGLRRARELRRLEGLTQAFIHSTFIEHLL